MGIYEWICVMISPSSETLNQKKNGTDKQDWDSSAKRVFHRAILGQNRNGNKQNK
jgi:hypothetical protein